MKYVEEIKTYLEGEHTKVQRDKIIAFIGANATKFKALMHVFLDRDLHWRFNQRAAWPIGVIGKKKPEMIRPYHSDLVKALDDPAHVAVKRNIVRVFEDVIPDESIEGLLFEKCFSYLQDTKEAVAVRCFSITVLGNIVEKYPELQEELVAEMREHLPYATAGFKSRAKKVIAKLEAGK